MLCLLFLFFFFFNDTATTEIYTLSLHDALPIWSWYGRGVSSTPFTTEKIAVLAPMPSASVSTTRSEEHTSELQSQSNLVCRLLLEKKKKTVYNVTTRQTQGNTIVWSPRHREHVA